jgi:pimeloyl-ACP methyl ester carboxylesterase
MITSIVKADGADLYVERRGDGPPLLMIAGGGGDGGAFTTLADILAASRIPVALAVGTDTIPLAERADLRPYIRPCTAIAARLGAEFAEFPGGHLAPMELPAPFAAGLRDVFGRL